MFVCCRCVLTDLALFVVLLLLVGGMVVTGTYYRSLFNCYNQLYIHNNGDKQLIFKTIYVVYLYYIMITLY